MKNMFLGFIYALCGMIGMIPVSLGIYSFGRFFVALARGRIGLAGISLLMLGLAWLLLQGVFLLVGTIGDHYGYKMQIMFLLTLGFFSLVALPVIYQGLKAAWQEMKPTDRE